MPDLAAELADNGFVVFDPDQSVLDWVQAAYPHALKASQDPDQRKDWLRHGGTWFVGVDALENDETGAVGSVPLRGPWDGLIDPPAKWHRAQISVTYPNYPVQDAGESDAAHGFRVNRCGAHVDGLHLENGRRIVREPHAFILGVPLNASTACPLVVWRKSHVAIRTALSASIGPRDPIGQDVSTAYKAARASVFETCERLDVHMRTGQAVVLDRHLVHGVAPWREGMSCPPEGRMIAYFRPECTNASDWL